MIYDHRVSSKAFMKTKTQSLVKQIISAKELTVLTQAQLNQFVNQHQIIHCAAYMDDHVQLNYDKLIKLYFTLFQIGLNYGNQQNITNFIKRCNFTSKMQQCSKKITNKNQKILLTKISKFLDSFKQKICIKTQLNSLVSQYHQFRLLTQNKNSMNAFVAQTCILIRQYIYGSVDSMIKQIQLQQWQSISDAAFEQFYNTHYCELCTIWKRVNNIKCNMIGLPVFQVKAHLRRKIQERYKNIINKQYMMNDKETKESEQTDAQNKNGIQKQQDYELKQKKIPILKAKRKMRAFYHLITQ